MRFMKTRRVVPWLVGCLIGYLIWAAARPLFGVQEPWDGSFLRYFLIVFLTGAACEIVAFPRRAADLFYWPVAFVVGELMYMATQPERWSLWPLALIAIIIGATPAMIGVAAVRRILGSRERGEKETGGRD